MNATGETIEKSFRNVILFILLSLAAVPTAQGQQFGVIKGTVVDRVTRTPIQNVNVFFRESPRGTVTDSAGRFTLRIPLARSVQVILSHVAYDKIVKTYLFNQPDTLFLETTLQPRVIPSGEVTVKAERSFAERRALYEISSVEIQRNGEKDMEHKLRYFLPNVVKPYEVRMMHPSKDFTLYLDGKWIESDFLNDVDPDTVVRVLVWGGIGNEPPVGFPAIRGGFVVSIETK